MKLDERVSRRDLAKIRQKIEKGAMSIREVSKRMGITPNQSRDLGYSGVIKEEIKKKRVKMIQEALQSGPSPYYKISERIGLSHMLVYKLAAEIKDKVSFVSAKPDRVRLVKQLLKKKEKSIEVICKAVRITPGTLYSNYYVQWGVKIPFDKMIPYRCEPTIDAMIDKLYTLTKMGKKVGLTRERVRHYVRGSGQYGTWIKNKRERREQRLIETKNADYNKYVDTLKSVVYKAGARGWVKDMTIQHFLSLKNKKRKQDYVNVVYTVLKRYYNAERRGEKISYDEMGEGVCYGCSARLIVKRLNLKSINKSPGRGRIPESRQKKLRFYFDKGYNISQAAKKIGMCYHTARQYFIRFREGK